MAQGVLNAALDDSYAGVAVTDFSGGRNTEKDPHDLELNESADCLNVKFRPGKLLGRGGYVELLDTLPSANDGCRFFFDRGGNRRQVVWSNGNLYQVTFGVSTLIAAGVYNAGNPIAHVDFAGILYYSDGVVPIRYWDPIASTEGQLVAGGGGGYLTTVPACKVLTVYAGALVAGATTVDGVFEPDGMRWSDVNAPSNWNGTAIQYVGAGTGGEVNALSPMGVSDAGVSPFRSIFVGKSREGVFGFQGALGELTEFLIPAPTGVLDGRTVQFIPGPDGRAYVAWLGTDRKVWYSNGITAAELSSPIRTELALAILERVQSGSSRFNSVRNSVDYQYILDLGDGVFFVYDYDNEAWTKYEGWPSGYWTEGVDSTGFPAIYVASDSDGTFHQANYGDSDNGSLITFRWKSGFIHAGNAERLKDWDWLYTAFATDSGQLEVTIAQGSSRNTTKKSATGTITASGVSGSPFVLDSSLLDGDDVLTAGVSSTFDVFRKKMRIRVASTAYVGTYGKLKASDVQVTIQQSLVQGHFELLGFKLLYLNRGYRRVG